MQRDYYQQQHEAWVDATGPWPKREYWDKKDVDQLRAEYIAEYGYGVLIPDFDDIVHYKPLQDLGLALSELGTILRQRHVLARQHTGRHDHRPGYEPNAQKMGPPDLCSSSSYPWLDASRL